MAFNHVIKHQRFITFMLFVLFSALIIVQIILPDRDIDASIALLAGWMGIVIGFFFSQEMSEYLRNKLYESEMAKIEFSEKTEENIKEILHKQEQATLKYSKKIQKLLRKAQKK